MIDFDSAITVARLAWKQDGKSTRTVENYGNNVTRLAREVPITTGTGYLLEPTKARKNLTLWRGRMQERYESANPDVKISASKIKTDRAALISFYAKLVEANLYESNPAEAMAGIAQDEGLPRPMPMEHAARLLGAPDVKVDAEFRDRVMLELALGAALRVSEIIGLTGRDVDYDPKYRTLVLTIHGKGGGTREAVLKQSSSALLAAYLHYRFSPEAIKPEEDPHKLVVKVPALLRGKGLPMRRHLFEHNGKGISLRETERRFPIYRTRAKLPDEYGWHTLRHTCLTELTDAGADIRKVQEVAGHKRITTTTIYTRVSRGGKASTLDLLEMPSAPEAAWKRD